MEGGGPGIGKDDWIPSDLRGARFLDSIRWCFVDHDDGNFAIPTIAQSDTDAAAMPLLGEHVPDFADLLGPNCVAILNSGRKLELEALLRRRDATRQQNQDWEYVDRGVWDTAA